MLRILDHASRMCDGVSRRDAMQVGALSLFAGMSLPRLLRGAEATVETVAAGARVLLRGLGGKFAFDLTGEIKSGKEFFVVAKVTDPAKGQTLTLKLEPG